jgi:hypothetical protein
MADIQENALSPHLDARLVLRACFATTFLNQVRSMLSLRQQLLGEKAVAIF